MGNRLQKIQKLFKKTPNALFCLLGAVVFLAGVYFISYRTGTVGGLAAQHNEQR